MTRLLRLYPRRWRDEYEAEIRALLEDYPLSNRDRLDLILSAARSWVSVLARAKERPSRSSNTRIARGLRSRTGGRAWRSMSLACALMALSSTLAAPVLPPLPELGSEQVLASGTLPALGLQPGDLGLGYRQVYAGYERNPHLYRTDRTEVSLAALRRHGYVRSLTASFQLPSSDERRASHPETVWFETISMYRSFNGAFWAYHVGLYGGSPAGGLGQHARLFLHVPRAHPGPSTWRGLAIRYMRYNYVVTLKRFATPLRVLPLLNAAHTVDGRVKNLVERTAR